MTTVLHPQIDSHKEGFFIETYGCQMNVNDSEVVAAVLQGAGYSWCPLPEEAQIVLINTCAIRDNAEQRIWGRLDFFRQLKRKNPALRVGVLGCMAQRLKDKLFTHPAVDLVAGPDAYRSLPDLLRSCRQPLAERALQMNVRLLREELYADISPVRLDSGGVSAYISIMRGCNNCCAYCVVPYTRGGERSRDPQSILREARELFDNGYREVSLLGQNVDSYFWKDPEHPEESVDFARLLEMVALISPLLRVRFSTSHPKDMTNGVLYTMAMYDNICNHIHLPVQSGSNPVLERMKRKYTREIYLERIEAIRKILPSCAISTDTISGFCGETLQDHALTLDLMQQVRFDQAFMFQYSERPGTYAARHLPDDIPLEEKTRRLNELIALQNTHALENNQKAVGQVFEVLVEGPSKRSPAEYCGRSSQNKMCVFPRKDVKPGDYVHVKINACTAATLMGEIVETLPERRHRRRVSRHEARIEVREGRRAQE